MSLADRQKNAADGLFMLGMCTVTVTFLVHGDFHPQQKHLFPPFERKEEKQKCSNSRPRARLLVWSSGHFPGNYIQSGPFSSQLKGFAIGKNIREEGKLLVFCNVLEHRI